MNGFRYRLSIVGVLGLALAQLATAAFAEPTIERRRATLLVTAGLAGRLVDGDRTVADLAATLDDLAASRRAEGHAVAVIDAGITFSPYAESRIDGGATMMRALRAAGCSVFAPHPVDLSVGLRRFAEIVDHSTPTVVRAFDTDTADLAGLATVATLDLDGVPARVRAFDHPDLIRDLAAVGIEAAAIDPSTALALEDPSDAANPLQIAILHSHGQGLFDRKMAWSLIERPRGFDLLIDPDLGADLVVRREVETTGRPVFLIGRELSSSQPWSIAVIDLDLVRHGDGRWTIDAARQSIHGVDPDATADPDLTAAVRRTVERFEQRYGAALPTAAPTDRDGLEAFVLGALREATDAEIAILDRTALRPVDPRHFEATPLTGEAVVRLLSLDQGVVVGELTGAQLQALAADSATREPTGPRSNALRFLGLSFDTEQAGSPTATVDGFEVNGRTLFADDLYRVATSAFLASGGGDYPILSAMVGERQQGDGRAIELRDDIVLQRLATADDPLVDPLDHGLWRFGVLGAALTFDEVQVDADPAYADVSDSRASGTDSRTVRGDLHLFADQEWPGVRWQNRLRIRFGILDTEDSDELTELTDDVRFDSSIVFLDHPWLRGHPYFSASLDSELHRDRVDGRHLPRQWEQSLAFGLEWEGSIVRRFRFGVLARAQNDAETADRLGVVLESDVAWRPADPWPELRASLLAESVEDGDARIDRIDLELRLPAAVLGRLSISPGIDLYRYRDSRLPGTASYHRFVVSLSWDWSDKWQRGIRRR